MKAKIKPAFCGIRSYYRVQKASIRQVGVAAPLLTCTLEVRGSNLLCTPAILTDVSTILLTPAIFQDSTLITHDASSQILIHHSWLMVQQTLYV